MPRETKCRGRIADFVVASGSLPPGVPSDFYQRVADICRERGALLILDTSGAGLRRSFRRLSAQAERARTA